MTAVAATLGRLDTASKVVDGPSTAIECVVQGCQNPGCCLRCC
jgi:hypothetical protein